MTSASRIYSQDSTMVHSEIQEDSIVYKNNYYSIFQNDSDVKQLLYIGLKGPTSNPDNRLGDYLFFLDEIVFERRIFNQYSLNAAVYNLNSPLYSQQLQNYYGASILLKYYIPTKQDRINGKAKTNLTGPYIGVGYRSYFETLKRDIFSDEIDGITVQLGWQNRIFKYSYFNLVLNASVLAGGHFSILSRNNNTWQFYFNPELKFGAVLGNSKENYQACKVLNCQKDRDYLFKINVLELFRRRYSWQGMSFEYEQKLGKGAWSINGGLAISYGYYNFNYNTDFISEWEGYLNPIFHSFKFTGFIEPRYYHNLKKRMLRGISGNGFSANFIGLELSSINAYTSITGLNKKGKLGDSVIGVFANYGIQREIGNNLFCQLRAGIQYNHHDLPIVFARRAIPSYKGFGPGLDIKLGFAF